MDPRNSIASLHADDIDFLRRVLLLLLAIVLSTTLWALTDVVLLLFGAILIAIALRALSRPLIRFLRLPERWAILLALAVIVAAVLGVAWLFGAQLAQQMRSLIEALPASLARITSDPQIGDWTRMLGSGDAVSSLGTLAGRIVSWSTTLFGALASLVLVIFGGIYLALDPGLYRAGLLKLVPQSAQPPVAATLDDCGDALHRWLHAQILAMVAVGTATWLGLTLIGVPSALALGLIAGFAEFVPFLGPLVAAVPALLIAGAQDWQTLAWTAALLILIQQMENNLLVPLLAKRSVSIAPTVGIFSVVAMGVLFGPLGLLLGFPLTVIADTAIRRLYVLDALGKPVEILGETASQPDSATPRHSVEGP